jgi:Kef-type K+ transport system membrane component KefB
VSPLAGAPVAPIAAHQVLVFLLQLGLLLGLALTLGRLAGRLGLPPVVGELTAGVLAGPSVLGHAAPGVSGWLLPSDPGQFHLLDAVGQLGVLLLVGVAGMHVDLGLMRRNRLAVATVGSGALLIPLGLGVAVGFVLPATLLAGGSRPLFAVFLGVAMCVSAIPVIAKTLLELKLLHRDIGQLIINSAAVDDIVGWFLLAVISAIATSGTGSGALTRTAIGLVVIVVVTLAARPVVRGAMHLAARSPEPGVTVATAAVLVLLASAGSQALGTEGILGAFLCGILIGSSRQLDRQRLAPLRAFVMAVLAPLFFVTAGLRMDLTALVRPSVLAAGLAVLGIAVAGKFAGAYAGARLARLDHWHGLALGAGLNARGVVEVVVATVGLRMGVLGQDAYTIIVLVAIATSLMAPAMLRYAARRIAVTPEEHTRALVYSGAPGRTHTPLITEGAA